jgi:hypothetical protein
MSKQWELFIDKWVGPNMFGGYLAQTWQRKAEAVFWCVFTYSGVTFGAFCTVVAVVRGIS